MNEVRNNEMLETYLQTNNAQLTAEKYGLSRERVGQILKKLTGTRTPKRVTKDAERILEGVRDLYSFCRKFGMA